MINQEPEQPATRQRLVEAARVLFLDQGYTATGIAQILKAADARSGSLYHYFPTKEDLLIAVLEHYQELLCPAVIDPVKTRLSDPIERVFGVLDGYRQMLLMTNYQWGCPIGNLALEVGQSHPNARRLILANFEAWQGHLRGWLDEASGRLPVDTNPGEMTLFVLTTMEGAVMLARTYHSIEPYDCAVGRLRDYFDRLLADGSTWSAPRTDSIPQPKGASIE